MVEENEILSKELKKSKTEYEILKGTIDASTSSQQSTNENESHFKILDLEGKNEKLNALFLDSSDKVIKLNQ